MDIDDTQQKEAKLTLIKIEDITPEQWQEVYRIRDHWIEHTTDQHTEEQIKEAVVDMWKALELAPPKRIYVVDSPRELIVRGAAVSRALIVQESSRKLIDSRGQMAMDLVEWLASGKQLAEVAASVNASDSSFLDAAIDALQKIKSGDELGVDLSTPQLRSAYFDNEYDKLYSRLWSQSMERFEAAMKIKDEAIANGEGDPGEPTVVFKSEDRAGIESDCKIILNLITEIRGDLSLSKLLKQFQQQLFKSMTAFYIDDVEVIVLNRIRYFARSQPYYVGWFWRIWAGFYRATQYLGVQYDEALLDRFCMWVDRCPCWISYKDMAIICRNPIECNRENGRVGSTTKPAAVWPDGFEFFCIEGVTVNKKTVMDPKSLTIAEIQEESNEERRRIMIQQYGWPEYLANAGAMLADKWVNPVTSTPEFLWKTKDGMVVFMVGDPSIARVYSLPLPDEVNTCEEAQKFLSSGLSAITDIMT